MHTREALLIKDVDEGGEDGGEDMQSPFQCFPMPHQEAPGVAPREFKMSLHLYWVFFVCLCVCFFVHAVRLVGS